MKGPCDQMCGACPDCEEFAYAEQQYYDSIQRHYDEEMEARYDEWVAAGKPEDGAF